MTKLCNESVSRDRFLKQNPYAHLDEGGNFSALTNISTDNQQSALSADIISSRLILQDPYAHLDDDDPSGFSAVIATAKHSYFNTDKKDHYSDIEIEQVARQLQNVIWKNKKTFWPNGVPVNPVDMLDPILALNSVGYHAEFVETLGEFYSDGKLIEAAGTIDNQARAVKISRRFHENVSRYTSAHELGHALLHKAPGLHRDKPLDGTKITRETSEFEADKFAAYFLMPKNLVRNTFVRLFLTDRFFLDEQTTFALNLGDYQIIKSKYKNLRQLSRVLASIEHYNGVRFISLAGQFKVSIEAMAIRLEELELVAL